MLGGMTSPAGLHEVLGSLFILVIICLRSAQRRASLDVPKRRKQIRECTFMQPGQ
jgi:hypothetical protein